MLNQSLLGQTLSSEDVKITVFLLKNIRYIASIFFNLKFVSISLNRKGLILFLQSGTVLFSLTSFSVQYIDKQLLKVTFPEQFV